METEIKTEIQLQLQLRRGERQRVYDFFCFVVLCLIALRSVPFSSFVALRCVVFRFVSSVFRPFVFRFSLCSVTSLPVLSL